jgi:Zn-dependent peptidase ImmA (M78 family)
MAAGPDRARAAAKRARHALGLAPDATIRDICGLLEERAGVKVITMRLASDAFFGLSVAKEDGGPAVVVNAWDRISVERWIFTAAHELGHLLLHVGAYDVSKTEEDRGEEDEANQFASHFLLPHELFELEWKEARGLPLVDRVLKVKRIFRVSYRTVLYRLSEQEQYGRGIWQKFQVAYKARFGQSLLKSDEPEALHPHDFSAPRAADEPKRLASDDFVEDRLSGLVRVALEKELITVGRAAEILEVDLKTMRAITSTWVD